jgi:3-hydroxyisobutyrate dehydrogenase
MGQSMAGHILNAGYRLNLYNRSRDKAGSLIARGATWHATPGSLAADSDFIITMVGTRATWNKSISAAMVFLPMPGARS